MDLERRRHPRIDTLELVSFENYETTKTELMMGMGKTLDLSLGGMCLESRHALPLGSNLKLSIALVDDVISVEGKIMSLTLTDDLNVKVHIEFDPLTDEAEEKLSKFLDGIQENQDTEKIGE